MHDHAMYSFLIVTCLATLPPLPPAPALVVPRPGAEGVPRNALVVVSRGDFALIDVAAGVETATADVDLSRFSATTPTEALEALAVHEVVDSDGNSLGSFTTGDDVDELSPGTVTLEALSASGQQGERDLTFRLSGTEAMPIALIESGEGPGGRFAAEVDPDGLLVLNEGDVPLSLLGLDAAGNPSEPVDVDFTDLTNASCCGALGNGLSPGFLLALVGIKRWRLQI
jgi:hypothetical protein